MTHFGAPQTPKSTKYPPSGRPFGVLPLPLFLLSLYILSSWFRFSHISPLAQKPARRYGSLKMARMCSLSAIITCIIGFSESKAI